MCASDAERRGVGPRITSLSPHRLTILLLLFACLPLPFFALPHPPPPSPRCLSHTSLAALRSLPRSPSPSFSSALGPHHSSFFSLLVLLSQARVLLTGGRVWVYVCAHICLWPVGFRSFRGLVSMLDEAAMLALELRGRALREFRQVLFFSAQRGGPQSLPPAVQRRRCSSLSDSLRTRTASPLLATQCSKVRQDQGERRECGDVGGLRMRGGRSRALGAARGGTRPR